jgi:transcriptional regulator
MFVRGCWKPHTIEEIYKLIDENEWALLISNGATGPLATNLPLLLDRSRGKGVLSGHLARANEHAELLRSIHANHEQVLAVFQGPYSYVTASWYPKRDMPSTYYYTLVHCYGTIRLMNEEELARSVEELTEQMEAKFDDGWKMTEIPEEAVTRRYKHILGFTIEIDRVEAKFKLGQDEPRKDALAVAQHLDARGRTEDRWLADKIRQYSEPRPGE